MDDKERLEEAQREVEKSKSMLTDLDKQKSEEGKKEEKVEEGSGIFTADGKELPKIDGGYDIINPGGSLGDDEFVSV